MKSINFALYLTLNLASMGKCFDPAERSSRSWYCLTVTQRLILYSEFPTLLE